MSNLNGKNQQPQSGVSQAVRQLAEKNLTPMPAGFEEVVVKINCNALVLQAYVEELYANLESAMAIRGGVLQFTLEELHRYVRMLVKARVDYVNGRRVVAKPTDMLAVPSFLSVVLESVGVVSHIDLGLYLTPECEGEELDLAFMQRISRMLVILGSVGLEYSKGYSRSKDGSWDFMTMTLIDGYVKAPNKEAHPVYALLSSVIGVRGIEQLLSPRVTYGTESHFQVLVKHCAMLKG